MARASEQGPKPPGTTIRGVLRLPEPRVFDGAVAVVGLDDVTYLDAPARRIAESVIDGISGPQHEIPFRIEVTEELRPSGSFVLAAEVRTRRDRRLGPGDYVTTVAHPWAVGDRDYKIVVVSLI